MFRLLTLALLIISALILAGCQDSPEPGLHPAPNRARTGPNLRAPKRPCWKRLHTATLLP